jgi:hypothetical protein
LDEAEHDIKNYSDRGQCYCRSEAEADNIDRGLNNSWCYAKAESNNCFIIHLKTSETYKMIKWNLVMFQVYLFYFRALLSLSCWPYRGLGTTASNNIFFGCKFDPKKLLLDAEHVSSSNYVTIPNSNIENYPVLSDQSGTRIHTKCIIIEIIFNLYEHFTQPED